MSFLPCNEPPYCDDGSYKQKDGYSRTGIPPLDNFFDIDNLASYIPSSYPGAPRCARFSLQHLTIRALVVYYADTRPLWEIRNVPRQIAVYLRHAATTTLGPMPTTDVSVRTLDGLHLAGTLVELGQPTSQAVVLIHGGGVTREEGGFFTRLADGLAEAGVASLRFDLRGHGQSEGRQEELTLSSILNDIRVMLAFVREATNAQEVTLLGASFGGGICAYYAAQRPDDVQSLVLFNPQLNYKKRTIDSRPYWTDDVISDEAAAELTEHGAMRFTPTLRHGRPMLNEVFWLRPHEALGDVQAQRSSCTAPRTLSYRSSPPSRPSPSSALRANWSRSRAHSTASPSTTIHSTSIPRARSGRRSSFAPWPSG